MGSTNGGPIRSTASIGSRSNPSGSSNVVAGPERGGEFDRASNMEKVGGVKHMSYNKHLSLRLLVLEEDEACSEEDEERDMAVMELGKNTEDKKGIG